MSEPKKYRIGEVAELLNLKTHVLRFWETEFPQLAPLRTESGQRFYTENDVCILRRIQQLLHEQGMTIEGARRVLDGGAVGDSSPEFTGQDSGFLTFIEEELADVCNLLARESLK